MASTLLSDFLWTSFPPCRRHPGSASAAYTWQLCFCGVLPGAVGVEEWAHLELLSSQESCPNSHSRLGSSLCGCSPLWFERVSGAWTQKTDCSGGFLAHSGYPSWVGSAGCRNAADTVGCRNDGFAHASGSFPAASPGAYRHGTGQPEGIDRMVRLAS